MKHFSRKIRRLSVAALVLLLSLQLSGCSWFFMPGPVIITDEVPTKTESSREETSAGETETAEPSPENTASEAPSESPTEMESEDPTETASESPTETAAETDPETAAESAAETLPEESSETEPPSGAADDESTAAESSTDDPSGGSAAESTEAPETFSVDYFRTPESLRAIASDAVFADAYNVISACLAYRTSAKVSCAKEDTGRVIYIADTLCPLLKAFTDISEDSWKDGEISWEFYVDKVAFAIVRAEFEAEVAAYIEPCLDPVYNETERALLLYHAYTEPASYNYEIISGAFKTRTEAEKHRIHSAYAGIMDHTGVCHDLAGGMTFLFIQAGFDACRISVIGKENEHSWTMIELDGRYTCCDATWDVGGSFAFFGTSAAERTEKSGGSYHLEDMNIYDFNAPAHFDIVNPGFTKVLNFARRIGTGTLLSLSIDTGVQPHRLIYTGPGGARLEIDCP